MDYNGRRVTIMGLGHFGGGMAAARWLARRGAAVTVTDTADERALAASLATLAGVPIAALHLGGHRAEDFSHAELLVVNPAVRPGNRFLELARQAGARIDTEIGLFLEACPARVIGVTGSNGKSTTAAMIAAILRAQGVRNWLGGNLGGSLLEQLEQMEADDWVVLELSSFQLWHIGDAARMPCVAVVTGCRPNHLDWHEDFAEYVAAKQRILDEQTPQDLAVLNTYDAEVGSWSPLVRGRQVPLPPLETIPRLLLPGRHNRINAACAAAAAWGALAHGKGVGSLLCEAPAGPFRQKTPDPFSMLGALASFGGLPQRLEWFAVVNGRRFYNDSTATTPESTIAALEALEGPLWLLVGGADKGCEFGPLVTALGRRARGVALFGAVAAMLHARLAEENAQLPTVAVATMEEALAWCWSRSQPQDSIVLSPACSSHDQFQNFRQRGERFAAAVASLAGIHPM